MNSLVLKLYQTCQGQSMPLFLAFLLAENDVIAQIVSYIGKELLAKMPTIVAVFVLALAPWAWQTIS
jgi:hypothetical protein